ncbi:hypothetical protein PR003_g16715 [Phytophthora rubi]|uniref:RxLR effector protein n=1 Tax=Phytophthora rubi TaxID=129364 RepID=A0A6A4EWK5_9STRA|nr:hypothetical protein PR002_g20136 [Phytophthora rubi]KAE8996843.1 hypothetical protein PR001_g19742 [Phytophthora rubi]KAE9324495.1 hypothetical protein PR003_g16715 [Phytophthora rubi]
MKPCWCSEALLAACGLPLASCDKASAANSLVDGHAPTLPGAHSRKRPLGQSRHGEGCWSAPPRW